MRHPAKAARSMWPGLAWLGLRLLLPLIAFISGVIGAILICTAVSCLVTAVVVPEGRALNEVTTLGAAILAAFMFELRRKIHIQRESRRDAHKAGPWRQ